MDDPNDLEMKFSWVFVPADPETQSSGADDLAVSDQEADKLDADTSRADN